MKKLLSTISIISISLLVSCSSADKKKSSENKNPDRVLHKSYVLMNAATSALPTWIEEPPLGDKASERKNYRYFVSESENKNKRLCTKSAEARATAQIAGEISQFIKNSYGESTQNQDNEVTEYMEETLAQEIQSFLVGAAVHRKYWEKRHYQESLGADRDIKTYTCFTLVKMSKKNLDKAIKNAMNKLYSSIDNPEVKQKTKKALNDVEDAFNKLEKPVTAQ